MVVAGWVVAPARWVAPACCACCAWDELLREVWTDVNGANLQLLRHAAAAAATVVSLVA